jgi:hypothetical protein
MKTLAYVLFAAAILLSNVMCAHVAYLYRAMLCGIEHMGYSAPANVAFLYAIPYAIGIAVCLIVGIVLKKKAKQ